MNDSRVHKLLSATVLQKGRLLPFPMSRKHIWIGDVPSAVCSAFEQKEAKGLLCCPEKWELKSGCELVAFEWIHYPDISSGDSSIHKEGRFLASVDLVMAVFGSPQISTSHLLVSIHGFPIKRFPWRLSPKNRRQDSFLVLSCFFIGLGN